MRKFTLIAMLLGVVMLAGCTGDDPAGPGGTLANVTNFAISDASAGTSVVLTWTAVASNGPDAIDGYKIYFNQSATTNAFVDGDLVGTIPDGTTTWTHAASSAGYYHIIAYEGDDTSEQDAIVDDLPNMISGSYEIWNNHAPASSHSGFIFGLTIGTTCLASSGDHDMYCYDGGQGNLTWLYSGDYGTFGDGNNTNFYEHGSYGTPGSGPWNPPAGPIVLGDVIFVELYDGYWAKIYVTALPHYAGGTDNAYGIEFYYDIQPIQGLKLFTTASQP